MTDVTGFGLLGHLSEECAGVQACRRCFCYQDIPKLPGGRVYCSERRTGRHRRNFASYGHLMGDMSREVRNLLCDPQTSGGLLLAVTPDAEDDVKATAAEFGIDLMRLWRTGRGRGGGRIWLNSLTA